MTVVRLKENKNNDVVVLSDGREVKTPKGIYSWGSVVYNEDIVRTETSNLCHKSMIPPVKPKKERDYYLCRGLEGYDPKEELELIRSCILKVFYEVMGRSFWYSDELEDLIARFAELFCRRHVYQKYSPDHPGTYEAYAKAIVVNMLIDYRRELSCRLDTVSMSLNKKVGDDVESIDFLADLSQDVEKNYEYTELYDTLLGKAKELDKEGTGLPGVSYLDIFDVWVNGESLDDYFKKFKYPKPLLEQYVYDFRTQLHEAIADRLVV